MPVYSICIIYRLLSDEEGGGARKLVLIESAIKKREPKGSEKRGKPGINFADSLNPYAEIRPLQIV